MRDIKFRAWDKVSKQMLNIGLVDLDDMTVYSAKSGDFRCSYQRKTKCSKNENFEDVKRLIFMQYTGIKDKNGKEIYEGDIIYWSCDDFEENVVVFWDDEHLRWSIYRIENKLVIDCLYEYSESDEIEVIGNIYEKGVKK
ncbi:YopX family protein [Filifactor alocis]|uniref:YopX family protein n=1 Tax=Filifactor alocis TaxID=143361 RepID=UPI003FA067B8